jgi:phage shock protein C
MNTRRLYRSADDRILAGVAGGVAAYFDVDPVIVRIIWFFSVFFSGSLTFWAYVVMAIVVPPEPTEWQAPSPWAPGGAPVGGAGFVPGAPGAMPASYAPASDPGAPTSSADPGAVPSGDQQATDPGVPPVPGAGAPGFGPAPAPGFGPAQAPGWGGDWRSQRRQDRWQRRQDRWQRRAESRGGAGLVFGLLLILVGGMLAWHQIDPSFDLNITWPVVVIAFGAILVVSSLRLGGGKEG